MSTFLHRVRRRRADEGAPPGDRTTRLYPPEAHTASPEERAVLAGERLRGICSVCGARNRFLPFTDNLRESGHCPRCGSSNRARQMAWMLRHMLGLPMQGRLTVPDRIAIYNTEANGALHAELVAHPMYECSEYWGDKSQYGARVDGVRNEDLQALNFSDASFDFVLSSDVFEHMPDPYRAHREVLRVLKPGGCHIFTVPYGEAMLADDVRASLEGGEIVHHAERQYHGDPVRPGEGILVWNVFGLEMLVRLGEIGFETELWRLNEPGHGIVGPGADVFVARKVH